MRTSTLILVCTLLAVGGTVGWAVSEEGAEYEGLTLVVPQGDAAAGERAFVELSCTSCHRVVGHDDLPVPVSANLGPVLGPVQAAHAQVEGGSVASSIISPSHVVTRQGGEEREGKLSPMGDFSEAMTVRQLIDLLAFIRSLDGDSGE
jgi:hypothetical protein